MLKADKLRAEIALHYPDLARDPERLRIFTEKVKVRPIAGATRNFHIAYELQLFIIDLTTSALGVFLIINDFLRRHQPDLCASQSSQGYDCETEIQTNNSVDILITLPLTENVIATPRDDGGWDLVELDEPVNDLSDFLGDDSLMDDQPVPLLKEIWHRGEKLLPEVEGGDGS